MTDKKVNTIGGSRRNFIKVGGVALVSGLAGCTGGGGDGGDGGDGGSGTVTQGMDEPNWDDYDALNDMEADDWRNYVVNKVEEEEEGKITFYGDAGAVWWELVQEAGGFDSEHDIYGALADPDIVAIRGGEIQDRYQREAAADRFVMDAAVMTGGYFQYYVNELPFGSVYDIPAWKTVPDYAKTHPWNAGVTGNVYGFCYNPDMVDSPPQSWSELGESQWSGEILINHSSSPGNTQAYLNVVGEDNLEAIGDNDPTYEDSTLGTTRRVAEGEFAIGMMSQVAHVNRYAADLSVEHSMFIAPELAVFAPPSPVVMAADPPHPWSAKLFLDWRYHEDHQEFQAHEVGSYSMHGDFSRPQDIVEVFQAKGGTLDALNPTDNFDQVERYDELVGWPINL